MKQTLAVKLVPSPEQYASLLATMERFNAACDAIAIVAYRERCANKVRLQKIVYYSIRADFGLPSQLTIHAVRKVVDAYKRDRSVQPRFRPHGAITYDQRIMSWKGVEIISLLTLGGRQRIPVSFGPYQAARLDRRRGQADLVYRDGVFYLYVTIDTPEPPPGEFADVLGVDLGIVNIAADSDGETHSGSQVNGLRKRHTKLRARLQSRGTKSARRLLKKRSRKESRFARDINHVISKKLVAKAKCTKRAIALEDLQGIRSRIKVRRPQRRQQHSWSFGQLRSFLEYKARLAGVPILVVNPHYTSQTCPACGQVARANRSSQAKFLCTGCGLAGPADTIAAENIRVLGRAAVMQPYAAGHAA